MSAERGETDDRRRHAPTIRVLGPVSIAGEQGLQPVRGQAGVALAVLAAAHPHSVRVDRLVDTIWPERPTKSARTGLRVALHRLRALLGELADVEHEPEAYRLVAAHEQIDTHCLDSFVASAEACVGSDPEQAIADLRAALELWRGGAFTPHDDLPELRALASHWNSRRLDIEDLLVDAMLAGGRSDESATYASVLVEAEPYRERRWEQLVVALYNAGRQHEALTAAREACGRIRSDLGLEPSASLLRLEDAVLQQALWLDRAVVREPAPSERTTAQPTATGADQPAATGHRWATGVSARVPTVMGRHELIELLESALVDSRCITLVGPAGVGKTTVARTFVHSAAEGRVLWMTIADADTDILTALGGNLGISSAGARFQDVSLELARRPTIVVLDDAETGLSAVRSAVSDLIEAVPDLRILVTSRAPLDSSFERIVPVPPLDPDSATALFIERAYGWRSPGDDGTEPRGEPVPDESRQAVRALVDALDRLPLCIELFAPLARSTDPAELLAALGSDTPTGVPMPDAALAASIAHTMVDLPAAAVDLHRRMAVFEESFDLDDIEAVCGLDRNLATGAIHELVSHSLLTVESTAAANRYRQMFAVRRAARVELEQSDAGHAVTEAHTSYFERAARSLPARLAGPDERSAVAFVHARRAEFAAMFGRLCVADPARALHVALALWDHSFMRLDVDWYDQPAQALALSGAHEHPVAVEVAAVAAFAAWVTGDPARVRRNLKQSSEMARAHGLEPSLVALLVAANVEALGGDDVRATAAFVDLFEATERRGTDRQRADVAVMLTLGQVQLGQIGAARASAIRSLDLATGTGNPSSIAWANFALGWVELPGDPIQASRSFLAAVRTARSVRNRWIEGMAVSALATSAIHQGRHAQALGMIRDMVGLWGRTRSLPQLERAVREAALVADALGQTERAARIVAQLHRLDPGHPLLPVDQERFDELERRVGLTSEPETAVAVWSIVVRELELAEMQPG